MIPFMTRLQRFCYADVEIEADSPQEAIIGALQSAIAGVIPEEDWRLTGLTPNTVKPVGQPRQLPARERLQGQEAFEQPQSTLNLDDLPDGSEVPDEALEGIGDHDGEIVEDVDASGGAFGDPDAPDMNEGILEYLMLEQALDEKRQAGDQITAAELTEARELRAVLITALTPVDDDEGITEAPATDPVL